MKISVNIFATLFRSTGGSQWLVDLSAYSGPYLSCWRSWRPRNNPARSTRTISEMPHLKTTNVGICFRKLQYASAITSVPKRASKAQPQCARLHLQSDTCPMGHRPRVTLIDPFALRSTLTHVFWGFSSVYPWCVGHLSSKRLITQQSTYCTTCCTVSLFLRQLEQLQGLKGRRVIGLTIRTPKSSWYFSECSNSRATGVNRIFSSLVAILEYFHQWRHAYSRRGKT
jgi:hypothetical protein